jgi:hexokinase
MKRIVGGIVSTFKAGLEKDGNTVPMLPTYVFGYPSGHETGDFIAVDLGGTNLRVCFVTLKGDGKFEVTQTKYRLTDEQKQEDGQQLFDFCARCVKNFLRDQLAINEGDDSDLVLGFTVRPSLSKEGRRRRRVGRGRRALTLPSPPLDSSRTRARRTRLTTAS